MLRRSSISWASSRSRAARYSADSRGKLTLISLPVSCSRLQSSREGAIEVIEAPLPAVLVLVSAFFGRDAAVGHQHGGHTVPLEELELDQLRVRGIVVPDPGEGEPV